MKHQIAILPVVLIAALAIPDQGVAAGDRVMADSAPLVELNSQLPLSALKNDIPTPTEIAVPSQSASSTVFRDIPSINGRYSLGGRTLLPYVGAGFAGGYASEFNRSLGAAPPTQTDLGLRTRASRFHDTYSITIVRPTATPSRQATELPFQGTAASCDSSAPKPSLRGAARDRWRDQLCDRRAMKMS